LILLLLISTLCAKEALQKKIEIRGLQNMRQTSALESQLLTIFQKEDFAQLSTFLTKYRLKVNQQLSTDTLMIFEVRTYSKLYNAVIDNDIQQVRQILENPNVDVERVYHDSYTALIVAAYHGQDAIVKMLLAYGADVDKKVGRNHENALNHAIWQQHFSTIKLLVEAGADLEMLTGIAKSTPLMHAARNKSVMIVKYLLEKGANPNASSADGVTPLMYALLEHPRQKGNHEIISLLLTKSDLNQKTKRYDSLSGFMVPCTALIYALESGRSDALIEKFIAHGAKMGESDAEKLALLKAYERRRKKYLLTKEIDTYIASALKVISIVGYSFNKDIQITLALALSEAYEMLIIKGKTLDKKNKKLFEKLANENTQVAAYHDMLIILEQAKKQAQDTAIKTWQKKYKKSMLSWCFKDLKSWAHTFDIKTKTRLLSYIKVFETKIC
jgi:ankyrin repeat protein